MFSCPAATRSFSARTSCIRSWTICWRYRTLLPAASHFQVPLRRGVELTRGANQKLSGIQKTFKYIMSHYNGKIEILDVGEDNRVYMRYHQNRNPENIGKIFSRPYVEGACWLDDLPVN